MRTRSYRPDEAEHWDAFCDASYNATFLHHRRFLSYHGERFVDRSIVIEDDGKWLGGMPAARHPGETRTLVSHPGISYGGIVHQGALRGMAMQQALRSAATFFRESGFERLQYKALPHIYHRAPAQDDLYALQQLGAHRYRCDLSTCIDLERRLPVSERRQRSMKKAGKAGVSIEGGLATAGALWQVLDENLKRKHATQATHTEAEICLLAQRFPNGIQFRVARLEGEVVAGVVLFLSGPVVHTQYIAASERGYEVCALDAIMESCIAEAAASGSRFFDFGISTDAQGTVLNEGLYRFKSEFGGSGVVHEFYELQLDERFA